MIKEISGQKIWIVGNVEKEIDNEMIWNFCGAYSTKEKAEEIAKRFKNSFIGPVKIDDESPAGEEIVDWPGAYYLK